MRGIVCPLCDSKTALIFYPLKLINNNKDFEWQKHRVALKPLISLK